VSYLAAPCWHCEEPLCVPACPAKAIIKRDKDGIVVVDRKVCLGNEACDEKCRKACPYDAPQFGPDPGAKMGKCDLCLDRLQIGKRPVCVEACPVRALDAGPLAELERKYGDMKTAIGFSYAKRVHPSVVFKSKSAEL
jgi:anaerobic dimethyl sulfoxide reductase subunit B